MGFATYKFRITLNEITCKKIIFIRQITAYGHAGFFVHIYILVVGILRVMRSPSLIDVPHLNLLLFDLRLLWRPLKFTDGCNSRILKSFTDNLVGQVLYIGEALAILGLIFTRDETASHGVVTHPIIMVIKSIL